MRTGENQLEGLHLERDVERQQELVEEDQREDELPEIFGEAAVDRELEHRGVLVQAMRAILERRQLAVSALHLPQQEQSALECLQAAVEGRDKNFGQFVFATDRADMLEVALAVLQPNLTSQDQAQLAAGGLVELTRRVAELRQSLKGLEDAQDELIAEATAEEQTTATDDAAKPGESSLTGPAIAEDKKPPSTLAGPAIAEDKKPPSTLVGPALPETQKPASTLSEEPKGRG